MSDLFKDKSDDWDGRDLIQRLSSAVGSAVLEQVPFEPSMQVLDFGAGTGLISAQVAPLVSRVVAVDISQSMLDKLVSKPELQGRVVARCQDILSSPLDERFDVVMSAMAMHHVDDTSQLLRAFWSHLHDGGRVALADLDAEDGSFHPEGVEGVFHPGFERAAFQASLEAAGFVDVRFITAHTVHKEAGAFPVFLVLATKPGAQAS